MQGIRIYAAAKLLYIPCQRIKEELVSRALFRAVESRRPRKGLIHHSDCGSHYCSHEYRRLLEQLGIVASMNKMVTYS
ncbi:MAG: DDE-type integrase/transposase/recombinase [Nitrospirae bacterium]|nr:DDE-type integrase/transposase/recombinase [Nitrospirota bacterium]